MTAHLLMITVIMLILMTAVSLIAVVLAKQKPDKSNKELRNLSIFMLGLIVFAFFEFYNSTNFQSLLMTKVLCTLSDTMYFAAIAAWINVLVTFAEKLTGKLVIKIVYIYAAIIGWGMLCESIAIFSGNYHAKANELFIENDLMRYILIVMNVIFAIAVVCVAIRMMLLATKAKIKNTYYNNTIFSGAVLIIYMIWILIFDYTSVSGVHLQFVDKIVIDPIFFICSAVDVIVLYFFLRKDSMGIFSGYDMQEQKILLDSFVGKYNLTAREKEVVEKVCEGLNNPDIAKTLVISEYTVKRHMNNIFQKTDSKNRYELISKVLR